MSEGADRIIEEAGQVLKNALRTYSNYRLVITGHSLGTVLFQKVVFQKNELIPNLYSAFLGVHTNTKP